MKQKLDKLDSYVNCDIENLDKANDFAITKIFKIAIINLCFMLLVIIFSLLEIRDGNILSYISKSFHYSLITISIILNVCVLIFTIIKLRKKDNDYNSFRIKYITLKVHDTIASFLMGIVLMCFIMLVIITPSKVSGDSMKNSYKDNDTILVWKLFYTPKNNDVIVIDAQGLHDMPEEVTFVIKRVVATYGDKVEYLNGNLVVNDKIIEQMSFSSYNTLLTKEGKVYEEVPKGHCIVLGDNRDYSHDSRNFGLIDINRIEGKSILRLFPNFGIPDKFIL